MKITLTEHERTLYDEEYNRQQTEFWQLSEKEKKGRGLVHLLLLRQMACHPLLWKKVAECPNQSQTEASSNPELISGKEIYVMEQIAPIIKAGQKCICVSQWTSTLDIYEERFNTRGWQTMRITGDKNADQKTDAVQLFNQPGGAQVYFKYKKG